MNVVFPDAVRVEANVSDGFTVQLILAIPLVNRAGFFTAVLHFFTGEPFRPGAVCIKIDNRVRCVRKLNAVGGQLIIHVFDQQPRRLVDASKT